MPITDSGLTSPQYHRWMQGGGQGCPACGSTMTEYEAFEGTGDIPPRIDEFFECGARGVRFAREFALAGARVVK
ncbi:MAG: hypothetical protein ACT4PT_04335 [Methanobacteriota archaeon]